MGEGISKGVTMGGINGQDNERPSLRQIKGRTADLTRLPGFATYAHNSTFCQLINQNFMYRFRILSRWYCTA